MRILTVANDLTPFGGLERTQLSILESLAERGHAVHLLHAAEGELSDDWHRFATCTRLRSTRVVRHHLLRSAITVPELARAVRAARPDIVYLHHYRHLQALWPLRALVPAPVVLHLHTTPPVSLGPVGRRVIRWPAGMIAVSQHTASAWSRFRAEIPAVTNGIDLDEFRPASADEQRSARQALSLPSEGTVVGFAGRITPEKGLDVLLDAWRSLDGQRNGSRLVIAGSGEPVVEDALRARATDGVEFVGFQHDLHRLYASVDVMVVPSVWPDPCPRAVLEAAATGNVVVGAAIGGIPEIIPHDPGGFLVPSGSVDALAERLSQLLAEPSLAGAGADARRQAESEASIERTVDRIADLLETTVREHR